MADNTNKTDTGNIPIDDNTMTRNTLKLKPIRKESLTTADAQKAGLDKVVDPLTQRNTETGPLGVMDDTKTRKTVKLKPIKKEGLNLEDVQAGSKTDSRPMINKVVDPLTQRNTETGPLDELVDTKTRKTVKLSSLKPESKPAIDVDAANKEDGMLKDTRTRKTLKLKAIKPEDKKPAISLDSAQKSESENEGGMKDTRTRRTLKLKAVKPEEQKPSIDLDAGADAQSAVAEDDTIKIQRPTKKPTAMPMPSLGATATAKSVNTKDTVKLSSPAPKAAPAAEEPKSSKATIKLAPKPQAEAPAAVEEKQDEAPTVNIKIGPKKDRKSKISIGKAPPPKTPTAPPATPEKAPEQNGVEPPEGGAGGLKLKDIGPKTEAPRAQSDQDKIKEISIDKRGGKSQASGFYTLVALITFVLLAFSALVTAVQYFNLWDLETIGGNKIEIPVLKDMIK
jgi:hypothetical protein